MDAKPLQPRIPEIFVARQPVLDRERNLIAYELLFRATEGALQARVMDDALATARVVERAFGGLGIDTVVGGAMAFINVDAESLMSGLIETMPADRVVIELLETIRIEPRIVRRCRELKDLGYRLALDDFSRVTAEYYPLLDLVDIVKVDVLALDPASLAEVVRLLKPWGAKLLAEKVECDQRARDCLALGFDLFQGFYFGRPALLGA
jgi:EAL and modified HD-GYP domain-containing signal transduction protein